MQVRLKPPKTAWKKGQSGNPAGKPKGTPNHTTREIRDTARMIVEDERGKAALLRQYRRGKLHPAVVVMLHHYAYGKPRDTIEVHTARPVGTMTTEEIRAELAARATAILAKVTSESDESTPPALTGKPEVIAESGS